MNTIKSLIQRFPKDEKGLETVEYAIIAGLIVAGTIATITAIGLWVAAQFNTLEATMNPAP